MRLFNILISLITFWAIPIFSAPFNKYIYTLIYIHARYILGAHCVHPRCTIEMCTVNSVTHLGHAQCVSRIYIYIYRPFLLRDEIVCIVVTATDFFASTTIETIIQPINPRGICVVLSRPNSDHDPTGYRLDFDRQSIVVRQDSESDRIPPGIQPDCGQSRSEFDSPMPPATALASQILADSNWIPTRFNWTQSPTGPWPIAGQNSSGTGGTEVTGVMGTVRAHVVYMVRRAGDQCSCAIVQSIVRSTSIVPPMGPLAARLRSDPC